MNKEGLKIVLQQFQEAQKRFEEALALSAKDKNDVIRDGTIQRFEFTFEICWKTMKRFLEQEGLLPKTPKETFQEAFRLE